MSHSTQKTLFALSHSPHVTWFDCWFSTVPFYLSLSPTIFYLISVDMPHLWLLTNFLISMGLPCETHVSKDSKLVSTNKRNFWTSSFRVTVVNSFYLSEPFIVLIFLTVDLHSILQLNYTFFIHSTVDVHLCCLVLNSSLKI